MNYKDFAFNVKLFPSEDKTNGVAVLEAANDHLTFELLGNVDEFIKKNPSTKEITSPIYFTSKGQPNPEGLFSNEIFGITKEERSGIFGYISLNDYFLHPLAYKKLARMDSKIKNIVHGLRYYSINDNGELVEDPNGKTGIDFLRKNFDKIKLKSTDSEKRNEAIKFIKQNRDNLFLNKWLVQPAFYRDVNTGSGGNIGVGEINRLYNSLIIACRSLKETDDFGLSTSNSTRGRIQETILAIYDYISGNTNTLIQDEAPGLSKKFGYIKRAGMSKTTDFGARLVITAPQLKVETVDDLMVDITHSAVPLHAVLANFKPFVLHEVKRFFENELGGTSYTYVDKKTNKLVTGIRPKDPMIQFSDERISKEIDRYNHGYSNRFIPVEVEMENNTTVNMAFKGTDVKPEDVLDANTSIGKSPVYMRNITWCDIFYLAACEVTKNKHTLVTRYPMDSFYNQFPTKIIVSSTVETEPIYYNGKLYKYYPKIREEDFGTDTSNKFIDTMRISNLMLEAIGGDYDGDTITSKGVFTDEANEELDEYLNGKLHYIGLGMTCSRSATKEAVQSIYDLTRVLPGTTLTEKVEFV